MRVKYRTRIFIGCIIPDSPENGTHRVCVCINKYIYICVYREVYFKGLARAIAEAWLVPFCMAGQQVPHKSESPFENRGCGPTNLLPPWRGQPFCSGLRLIGGAHLLYGGLSDAFLKAYRL